MMCNLNTLKAKEMIEDLVGKEVHIKVNVGRNKYEHFDGVVMQTYPYLFTVKVESQVKSFSYVDVLTKDVQLKLTNAWFMKKIAL